jgi:hypothetical protein
MQAASRPDAFAMRISSACFTDMQPTCQASLLSPHRFVNWHLALAITSEIEKRALFEVRLDQAVPDEIFRHGLPRIVSKPDILCNAAFTRF